MSNRTVANPLALAVLALLRERPMHAYEMASTLKERAKHESIKLNYGSLYGVVNSLVRAGFIVPLETEREGRRPERTIYGLTAAGGEELVDWLTELIRDPVKEYPRFASGLSLVMVLSPADATRLLEQRASTLEEGLEVARAQLVEGLSQGLPRVVLIETEYALALQAAELDFVRALVGEMAAGTLDGLPLWRAYHEGTGADEQDGDDRDHHEEGAYT